MFYVYVLKSKKDNKNYVGFTKNLKLKFKQQYMVKDILKTGLNLI